MPSNVPPLTSNLLTPALSRRIVRQYSQYPSYLFAATAAGISLGTLGAWRRRGEIERESLDADVLEEVAVLREQVIGGQPANDWADIEDTVGTPLSMFLRLVYDLEAARVEFANGRLAGIISAGEGRRMMTEDADGVWVATKDPNEYLQSPDWKADAWLAERLLGFQKAPSYTDDGEGGEGGPDIGEYLRASVVEMDASVPTEPA